MQKVKLGNYVEQIRGVSYKPTDLFEKLEVGSVILLRANNIFDSKVNFEDVVYVDKNKVKNNQFLRAGDILICTSSGSKDLVGKAAYIENDLNVTFGAFCKVIRPKGIESAFLGHFFQSQIYRHSISESCIGVNINNIRGEHIDNLEVPLPSLSEQKAIAEKLDKVSILIEKRKQQLSLLDTLVKSKFVEMFENQKYPKCKIGDLVEKDIKSARKNFQPNEVIRYIDISSIDNKLNRMKGFSRLLFGEAPSRAQQCIEKGDILVSTVRPNLRNIAINSFEFTNMVASSGFCILRAQKCERIYLLGAVLSENFSRKMSEITTGANYPAIKDSDVLSYYIPNPPKEIQQIFAHFGEEIEKTKAKVEQSLVALEFLKKSLMQKYFG